MPRASRYRLLAIERLQESLGEGDLRKLRASYEAGLQERFANGVQGREGQWTDPVAVGSRDFVERMRCQYRTRSRFVLEQKVADPDCDVWTIREGAEAYGSF